MATTKIKFRKSLLSLIKNSLNMFGLRNINLVLDYIEEETQGKEIMGIEQFLTYYASDENKEHKLEACYMSYFKK